MNRTGRTLLVLALVAVVGMAFRVSWNALRDVAKAVGADNTAATLYPFVVDGLMALALVATLVLDRADKRFALRVLAAYTLASLVLNYVHGLVPQFHARSVVWGRLADWDPANWALVLLATSLPVGSIFFGSDLVARVLHHRPDADAVAAVPAAGEGERTAPEGPRTHPVHPESNARSISAAEVEPERTGARTREPSYGPNAQVTPRTPAPEKTLRTTTARTGRTAGRKAADRAFDEAELERTRQRAEQAYAESLDAGNPIGPAALGREFGFSEGWGRKRIKAVEERRTAEADRRPHLVGAAAGS
ncbi:DUF2637 domain-containing protein [Streptomyces sp. LX-29]|uniref:DUF2637 domain-containing protein n=1 Tax=Streptomyces sp. LX-29 TaxID=2900152 RepID=UPI00240DEC6F|nr:DUF2637 domain-containing protein [Streptomyces sp. LX-29]WFB08616.1 DUF2637 domain-containing protein [Streptomyces sp. LX-29]